MQNDFAIAETEPLPSYPARSYTAHPAGEIVLCINPRQVATALLAIAAALILTSIATRVALYHLEPSKLLNHLDRLFNADREANFPSFFSTGLLFFSAVLLSLIAFAKKGRPFFVGWCFLAVIFFFLSLDESVQLHESIIKSTRALFGVSGYFFYAWVIPYGILTMAMFIAYLKFLLHLPKVTGRLFVVAGVCYVTGAIGFEMLDAAHQEAQNSVDLVEAMLFNTEELMEMTGIIIFIYALLSYVRAEFATVYLKVASLPKEELRSQ